MADVFASRTHVNPKRGRGKVIMSDGIAPAEKLLPDVGLATLLKDFDPVISNHFEIIMLKGTIITSYRKTYTTGPYSGQTHTVATPCIGRSGCELAQCILTTATGAVAYEDAAHAAGAGEVDLGLKFVPKGLKAGASAADKLAGVQAKPLGVLALDAYRPFSYGENEGVSWITHGYVEYPTTKKVDGATVIFDNTDLKVGDYIKPDALGRPVKFVEGVDPEFLRIGRVVHQVALGTDFDYGMLNYFNLPMADENGSLEFDIVKAVLTTNQIDPVANTVTAVFGLQPNVDGLLTLVDPATAVAGATGIVRVQLINL